MNNIYMPSAHKIVSINKQADSEWLFCVEFDLPAQAGQFVEVSLPKVGEAPISITRIHALDKTIELLIRKVGKVTNALFDLNVGDNLFLRGPYGNCFDLESFKSKEVLVVSGGSGLAPVREIINQFYDNKKFKLLSGFKDKENILFEKDIALWKSKNDNIHITLDCEDDDNCLIGFVTDHLDTLLKDVDLDNCVIVIVGPPLMMKFTTLGLIERGVKEESIVVSFERNMSCAVGKCGHCKIDETYVCLEGPVFSYTKAKTLLD